MILSIVPLLSSNKLDSFTLTVFGNLFNNKRNGYFDYGAILGDLNGDYVNDILDIVALVNCVLADDCAEL